MKSFLAPITKEELDKLPKDTTFARRIYTNSEGFMIQCRGADGDGPDEHPPAGVLSDGPGVDYSETRVRDDPFRPAVRV